MNSIYLLCGPVQSGKTTNLKFWCEQRKGARGILSPVADGRRYLYDISERRSLLLEQERADEQSVCVGPYIFDGEVFAWGRESLINSSRLNPQWLIVDEIGPLELKGSGLEPAVSQVLKHISAKETRLIMVVRDKLVDEVILHYGMEPDLMRRITLSDLKYLD